MLYALARCHDTSGMSHKNLVQGYLLLAALIHFLLAHIPEEARTACKIWPKLDSQVSVDAPCYPFPQAGQEVLWSSLKTDSDAMSRFQPIMAAMIKDLADILGLGEVTEQGHLTPAGSAELRNRMAPGLLSATVARVRTRYKSLWQQQCQVLATPNCTRGKQPAQYHVCLFCSLSRLRARVDCIAQRSWMTLSFFSQSPSGPHSLPCPRPSAQLGALPHLLVEHHPQPAMPNFSHLFAAKIRWARALWRPSRKHPSHHTSTRLAG